ncbi:hypothetical protein GVAV_000636 [Gurleya vavrai]
MIGLIIFLITPIISTLQINRLFGTKIDTSSQQKLNTRESGLYDTNAKNAIDRHYDFRIKKSNLESNPVTTNIGESRPKRTVDISSILNPAPANLQAYSIGKTNEIKNGQPIVKVTIVSPDLGNFTPKKQSKPTNGLNITDAQTFFKKEDEKLNLKEFWPDNINNNSRIFYFEYDKLLGLVEKQDNISSFYPGDLCPDSSFNSVNFRLKNFGTILIPHIYFENTAHNNITETQGTIKYSDIEFFQFFNQFSNHEHHNKMKNHKMKKLIYSNETIVNFKPCYYKNIILNYNTMLIIFKEKDKFIIREFKDSKNTFPVHRSFKKIKKRIAKKCKKFAPENCKIDECCEQFSIKKAISILMPRILDKHEVSFSKYMCLIDGKMRPISDFLNPIIDTISEKP